MKKIKYKLINIVFIVFLFIIYLEKVKLNLHHQIIHSEKNNSNTDLYQAAKISYDFVLKANSGILTNSLSSAINENPKISVVIPMLNIERLITRAILSVQNQNFSDFEIIIVNDFSNDNSFNIVNKLSQKDKRIKIINNKMNMGLLYSRCLGTLISKGKYIFSLDGDDMYIIKDTLHNIYTEAKNLNPDFI